MTANSLAVKGVKNFCKNFTNFWVGSAVAEIVSFIHFTYRFYTFVSRFVNNLLAF